jgi:hypothetical protein
LTFLLSDQIAITKGNCNWVHSLKLLCLFVTFLQKTKKILGFRNY